MLIVRNSIIPFKGYKAVNICGILFCRKNANIDTKTITHESIHTRQMLELLIIPYYIWYLIEYLIRLCIYRNSHRAYKSIVFEQEAYIYEDDPLYLNGRKWYSWMKYY